MSTSTEISLSPSIREQLIAKLAYIWIECFTDDVEDLVLNGFVGLKQLSDKELIEEYELAFHQCILDEDVDEDDFVNEIRLDIATNRILHAEG